MPKNSYVGYHSPTQGVWNTYPPTGVVTYPTTNITTAGVGIYPAGIGTVNVTSSVPYMLPNTPYTLQNRPDFRYWFGHFYKGRDYPNGAIKDTKALLKACMDACANEEVGKDAKYLYAAAPGLSEAIRLLVKINRGIVLESVPPVVLTEINLEDWNVPVRNDYSDGFLFANYWLAHGYHLKVNPKKSKEEQAAAVAAAPMPNPYMQQVYQHAQAAQQIQQAQLLGQYQQAVAAQNQQVTQQMAPTTYGVQGTAAPIASSTWTGRNTP